MVVCRAMAIRIGALCWGNQLPTQHKQETRIEKEKNGNNNFQNILDCEMERLKSNEVQNIHRK